MPRYQLLVVAAFLLSGSRVWELRSIAQEAATEERAADLQEDLDPPVLEEQPTTPEPPRSSTSPRKRTRDSERPPAYWLEQLSSPRFLRRESAQRHLYEAGHQIVPLLTKALRDSDFETTKRILAVMSQIANNEGPAVTDGAFDALQSIAKQGVGAKASIAATALQDSNEARRKEAASRLTQCGIFVGEEKIALGSQTAPRQVARIDDNWNKSPESLPWFRWLDGIEFALIRGTAASAAVFDAITKMPDLKGIVISDCELETVCLEALQRLDRIDVVEIRYAALDEDSLQALARLPIRNTLHLMGNGVREERIAKLELDMPGVDINYRKGGFLGVMCRDPRGEACMVSDVLPGSAAERAGLSPGDIIVKIDDATITRFEDLQEQVNRHTQGESILIQFRRNDQTAETKATLGKLAE